MPLPSHACASRSDRRSDGRPIGRHRSFDGTEEGQELLMSVTGVALSDDRAVQPFQGGKERRGTVPDIIVRTASAYPKPKGNGG